MKKIVAIATIAAFALSSASASAFFWGKSSSSDINVSTSNSASVSNTVSSSANTGNNSAYGGDASNNVSGKNGLNGMNEANGGQGGVIATGDAAALSSIANQVNTNKTVVDKDCGCKGDVDVKTTSSASVANSVNTISNTGNNVVVGGDASNSVEGGSYSWYKKHSKSSSKNGGNTANGGMGGTIVTGAALAGTEVVNVVNTNVTRVK